MSDSFYITTLKVKHRIWCVLKSVLSGIPPESSILLPFNYCFILPTCVSLFVDLVLEFSKKDGIKIVQLRYLS